MLLFAFARELFKFNAASPALPALFQLPPRIGKRVMFNARPLLLIAPWPN